MAVALDAASESHTGTSGATADYSWTHTPVGTPRGVLVFVHNAANAFPYGAVTYGGVALTAVPSADAADTLTEPGTVRAYFLGSGIPTGAQTVEVIESGTMTNCYAVCFTVTAGGDTTYAGVVTESQNQSITEQAVDDGSPGTNSLRFAGIYTGSASPVPVGANTTAGPSIDQGARAFGTYYETTAGQGSRPVGGVLGNDDIAAVYLAIIEAPAASSLLELLLAKSPLFLIRCNESSGTQAADASGNGRHATMSGSASFGRAAIVATDTCVDLAGGVLTIPYDSGLDMVAASLPEWTLFLVFDDDTTSGDRVQIDLGNIGFYKTGSYASAWQPVPNSNDWTYGPMSPNDTNRHIFAVIHSGNGASDPLYQDGTNIRNGGGSVTIASSTDDIVIGALSGGGTPSDGGIAYVTLIPSAVSSGDMAAFVAALDVAPPAGGYAHSFAVVMA